MSNKNMRISNRKCAVTERERHIGFESVDLLIVGCVECVSVKVKMLANGDAYVVDDVGNR